MMKPSAFCSLTMTMIFGAVMVYAVLSLGPQARLMPLLVAGPGFALSAFQLWSDLRREITESAVLPSLDRLQWRILLWIAMCIPVILLLGFDVGVPLLVIGFHWFVQRERMIITVFSAAIAWFTIAIVLNRFFGAQLYPGFLAHLFHVWPR